MLYCFESCLDLPEEVTGAEKQEFFSSLDKVWKLWQDHSQIVEDFPYQFFSSCIDGKKYFETISLKDDEEFLGRAFEHLSEKVPDIQFLSVQII